jgi:ferredoxin
MVLRSGRERPARRRCRRLLDRDLKRSGASLHVPPAQSILEVLEANGHEVPFSCREGLCGTCETAVCEGEVDHRDYVYPPAQRESLRTMLVCVSRAKSARLVLDL